MHRQKVCGRCGRSFPNGYQECPYCNAEVSQLPPPFPPFFIGGDVVGVNGSSSTDLAVGIETLWKSISAVSSLDDKEGVPSQRLLSELARLEQKLAGLPSLQEGLGDLRVELADSDNPRLEVLLALGAMRVELERTLVALNTAAEEKRASGGAPTLFVSEAAAEAAPDEPGNGGDEGPWGCCPVHGFYTGVCCPMCFYPDMVGWSDLKNSVKLRLLFTIGPTASVLYGENPIPSWEALHPDLQADLSLADPTWQATHFPGSVEEGGK